MRLAEKANLDESRGMELRQLEAFIEVAERLSFARAAEALHVAPSALSRAVRALETELGVELFERSTRYVALTSAGDALLPPAREMLAARDRAASAVSASATGALGTVRIEISGVASHPVVVDLVRRLRRSHPGISIELTSLPFSRPSVANLLAERTDIIIGRWDNLPPGVDSTVVRPDSLVVAAPTRHTLARSSEVSFAKLADAPFVALPFEQGALTTDRLWRLGHIHRFPVDIVQFAPDTPTCLAFVGAHMGLHLTMKSVGDRYPDPRIALLPLTKSDEEQLPPVHLRAAWRAPFASPAIETAVNSLLKHAQPAPPLTPAS